MISPLLRPREAEGREPEPSAREKKLLLNEMFQAQQSICYLCEKPMTREPDRFRTAVIEHVQPGKMGGCKDWSRSNLRAACFKCNSDKGSKRLSNLDQND